MRALVAILMASIATLATLAPMPSFAAAAPATAYVAIIIDDIGNNLKSGERAVSLPLSLTYAMLPHSPFAASLAQMANQQGKEVMLHMPMANLGDAPLGPGALTVGQSRSEFIAAIDAAISQIPFIRGINNHMGSQLTQQPQQMNWLMTEIKFRNLYFVDSRTTPMTVASTLARERHVKSSSRDVFLDNEQSFESIDAGFKTLLAKAKQNGTAIGIGHPYPATLDYLARVAPSLNARNITLLPVSALIARQQRLLSLAQNRQILTAPEASTD
jgi:polysaccharide deacetylase 2 family uncharacterized protein YibQ